MTFIGATSVGQIGLDLVVNQKQFNKQMTGIQSLAKKAGTALAGAFGVAKMIQFGKQCLELGSDLQEVENVVGVTFPSMQAKVDAFAKNAASSFGLSETMAKKYTGTLGSMAKAFGFSEAQAYDMGTMLTGLAGDVASFYNLSQDEAYTKLKSVFTGETESLKDLGVVMTQSALDSYALANGFGKTTSAMSEAEKVALRYAFVQDRLSAAQGDFMRTSNSWANQTKILSLQFESLKATIGQGLIAAFTPVIRLVNILLEKVQVLATSFKTLMESIFGTQSEESSALADVVESAAIAAESTAESTGTTADNLKKSSKFLAGFDVITKMSDSSESSSSGSSEDISSLDMSSSIGAEKVEQSADKITGKLQKLLTFTQKKFSPSFKKVWDKLKDPVEKFQKNFKKVSEDIQSLSKPLLDYLSGEFCDCMTSAFETVGYLCSDLLEVFNIVFEDVWNIVVYPFLNKLLKEWLPRFTEFITMLIDAGAELSDGIKEAFRIIWDEAAKPLLDSLSNMFWSLMDILGEFWNNWAEPILNKLGEALQKTGDILLSVWNSFLKPVFDKLMAIADELWNNHLAPLAANFLDFVGELVNGALEIYNKFIAPIVDWLVNVLGPVFSGIFGVIGDIVSSIVGGIIDVINGLITTFKGIVQFITGVFTGDWEKAWEGVKNIFKGIFDTLVSIVKIPMNMIIDIINGVIKGIVGGVNTIIKAINSINIKIPDWIPGIGGKKISFNLKEITAPVIPKLADGGFVKKNTPQLALIGDNRHQGEVVAPEDKLTEMAMKAVRAASGNDYSLEILKVLKEILKVLKELDLNIVVDGKQLKDIIVERINQHTRQTGVCEIIL